MSAESIKIIVVDDSEVVRVSMREILTGAGYTVW
jgi:CheY-like chemotaxis protein